MAGANSNIQVTDLDFNNIKTNLKKFLQSQSVLQDYNYEGSALSTLLDVLAYNTQYNAYYLNMVANEMFLDSALLRDSVVSQAKILNYTPKSAIAPTATIQLNVSGSNLPSLVLPKFSNFLSEAIDGVNYNFVTTDSYTSTVSGGNAVFSDVIIKQGITANVSFTVNTTTNPSFTFQLPDTGIDTTTLVVTVATSSTNNSTQVFNPASNFLELTGSDAVYFLQESTGQKYQIYFGDGYIGQQLYDGNIVNVSYLVTNGTVSAGANNFVLMDSIPGFNSTSVFPLTPANQGSDIESIDSIKFQAPKSYASQGRAVTKNDYITLIQQNKLGYSFDAVSVWGGEENNPPVYGKIFISLKPTGAYTLTDTQKQNIITDLIQPISVLTVSPNIVDPDYTYLQLIVSAIYDSTKTSLTSSQIQSSIIDSIKNFGTTTLNTFNSSFNSFELLGAINNTNPSITSSDYKLQLQKKFFPNLNSSTTYTLDFNTPLAKGMFQSGVGSNPALQFQDPSNISNIIDGVYFEEVPQSTFGVDTIDVINPGFAYSTQPIVTILGDGTGATAHAIMTSGGTINNIVVDSSGNNYTQAIVTITPGIGDTTGQLADAVANLQGRFGTLRTYYNTNTNVKTILNSNAGTIDYKNGIVTLTNFSPVDVDNPLGQLTITVNPQSTLISSNFNKIITIDPFDPSAITVNIIAK